MGRNSLITEKELLEILEYVEEGLIGFVKDPADSDYQEGYQAALEDLQDFILELKKP